MLYRLLLLAILLAFGLPAVATAQLAVGGSQSGFGQRQLRGGFTPDPVVVSLISGGTVDASPVHEGCTGFVSRHPDFIVRYRRPGDFLRFFAQGDGDTTLIVHDPTDRWHCNDDAYGQNPGVDIHNPPAGQYDVWVGSHRSRQHHPANLSVTENRQTVAPNALLQTSASIGSITPTDQSEIDRMNQSLNDVWGEGQTEDRGARREPPARVRLGRAQVRGALSREVVLRVMRRHQGALRQCYEELDTEARARVTLQLTISASGTVTTTNVSVSEGPEGLRACIVRVARRWRFPAPSEGEVNVRLPVIFAAR